MSEPIPESIPTSSDRRSHRPTKKRALTPGSQQSAQVEALFANPDREIQIPSTSKPKTAAAPPEIVTNVQGSSAGAGSGEFHVYKASRRREYERLRLMDEEVEREKADEEYEKKQEDMRKKDQEKLDKNRAKREKAKMRKQKANGGGGMEGVQKTTGEGEKKRLKPAKVVEQKEDESAANGGNGADNKDEMEEEVGITIHDDD